LDEGITDFRDLPGFRRVITIAGPAHQSIPAAHRKNNLGEIWRERNDAIYLRRQDDSFSCIVDDFSGGGG